MGIFHAIREDALKCSLAELSEDHLYWQRKALEYREKEPIPSKRYQCAASIIWRVITERSGCLDPHANVWR